MFLFNLFLVFFNLLKFRFYKHLFFSNCSSLNSLKQTFSWTVAFWLWQSATSSKNKIKERFKRWPKWLLTSLLQFCVPPLSHPPAWTSFLDRKKVHSDASYVKSYNHRSSTITHSKKINPFSSLFWHQYLVLLSVWVLCV